MKLLRGETLKAISRWLEETCEDRISYEALRNHGKNHLLPQDALPSNLIFEKLQELKVEINAADELGKQILVSKKRLAMLLVKEAILSLESEEPVTLEETRRVQALLTDQIVAYGKITRGAKDKMDISTLLSQRYEEIKPKIERMQKELEKVTP